MTAPVEYRLDTQLEDAVRVANATRQWRHRATKLLGFHPPTSFYRVLLLMRLTPHTDWYPEDIAKRAALQPDTAELVLQRMARRGLIVGSLAGYRITSLGREAAELR